MKTKYSQEESEHLFFTSDTHFYHKNILKYCNRPFDSLEEMNEQLISNWNSVVSKDSTIFHLGDFAFCGITKLREIASRLNGNIVLIKGNHDFQFKTKQLEEVFGEVFQQLYISIDNVKIYLNHFPYLCFHGMYDNEKCVQLHGHVHSSLNSDSLENKRYLSQKTSNQYDVGVDNNDYKPISWNKIKEINKW